MKFSQVLLFVYGVGYKAYSSHFLFIGDCRCVENAIIRWHINFYSHQITEKEQKKKIQFHGTKSLDLSDLHYPWILFLFLFLMLLVLIFILIETFKVNLTSELMCRKDIWKIDPIK